MLGDGAISEFAVSEFESEIEDIPPEVGKYQICGTVIVRQMEGEVYMEICRCPT